MESLIVTPISQAAANQRSGRAGRTGPGKYYYNLPFPFQLVVDFSYYIVLHFVFSWSSGKSFQLFTFWSFQNELKSNTVPEITATEILTIRSRVLRSRMKELIICLIYANLSPEQQAKIFEKISKGTRKVVLAKNITDTSFTIDGIQYVINTVRGRIFFCFFF